MIGFFIALISGTLMSIQGVFNTEVTKNSSVWTAAIFVQFTALLTCVLIWGVVDRESLFSVLQVEKKYMLLGGVIGAFITYTVIQSIGSLGPAKAALLIVIAQLIVAYAIELFGLFGVDQTPFSWRKIVGMLIAIGGIVLFKWE